MNHHITAKNFGLQSEETPWRNGRFTTRSIGHFGEVTRTYSPLLIQSLKLRVRMH
jgi:hypothetical protein